jgi:hypothetical protein
MPRLGAVGYGCSQKLSIPRCRPGNMKMSKTRGTTAFGARPMHYSRTNEPNSVCRPDSRNRGRGIGYTRGLPRRLTVELEAQGPCRRKPEGLRHA